MRMAIFGIIRIFGWSGAACSSGRVTSADLAYSRPDVEQCQSWDAFMAEYLAHGGRSYDADAGRYYSLFGLVRNAVFADSCLHSFTHAPIPEPKLAYAAVARGRPLITRIAQQLKEMGDG
jgi:hypothetical protein